MQCLIKGGKITTTLNVYGPPGTGKTTFLTKHFIDQVRRHGPDNVACCTYTRAAAGEFTFRASSSLRVRGGREAFPYVGTIHSLAYRALGSPSLVGGKEYRIFCEEHGLEPPGADRSDEVVLDLGDEDITETGEGAVLRRIVMQARHRHVPVGEVALAYRDVDVDRISYLADKYREWKQRENVLDFEDILVQGMKKRLPVRVLMLDESQDNSKLLWACIERWAEGTELFVAAGDPWQSIYQFAGAAPDLFRSHPGKWLNLEVSHRLTPEAAEYSKTVLRQGGWDDPFFDTWHGAQGVGDGPSTLYLARTHRLLSTIRDSLIRRGTPFGDYTRKAPLRTVGADAYRTISTLLSGQIVGWSEFRQAATYVRRYLSDKPKRGIPTKMPFSTVTLPDAALWLGNVQRARESIPNYEYFHEVERQHGLRGLLLRPQTMISTIHAAKGREASSVKLLSSWAWLPAKSLKDEEGRRREALVAYVAASRHKHSFELIDQAWGKRYPWPR